jgi:hypothetical protein
VIILFNHYDLFASKDFNQLAFQAFDYERTQMNDIPGTRRAQ